MKDLSSEKQLLRELEASGNYVFHGSGENLEAQSRVKL